MHKSPVKPPSPAPPAKALSKSLGHGDGRRVRMDLDFKREKVFYTKEEEEAFSLKDLQLSPDSQQLFELWMRFVNSKANTKAERATTQDSESSFVNSSEDGNGSDTSESRESNASHISSGDSAFVEESAVVPTLVEAIKKQGRRRSENYGKKAPETKRSISQGY